MWHAFVIGITGFSSIIVLVWLTGVWYVNDFAVASKGMRNFRRALVVFPHPDDETNIAGTLWQLHRRGITTTLAVLTMGECGTSDAHLDPSLKAVRSAEMRQVCQLLGASVKQEDLGDGQVAKHHDNAEACVNNLLKETQPDLVITYDLSGMYGHEDHIACSEIVTKLVNKHHPRASLWYVSFPEHLLQASHLPTAMAKDPSYAARRSHANTRIFVGHGVLAKIRSVYFHKSQRAAFRKSMPAKLPLWLVYSLQLFEYFEIVQ